MVQWMTPKVAPYEESIFDVMGKLCRKQPDCVNFGQGFPDFDGPDLVKEAAQRAIEQGRNQYAPPVGVPALNQALADQYREKTGLSFDPVTEISILGGATEAMYATLTGLCRPGDEFIVFAPIYDTYVPIIEMSGGTAVVVPLEEPSFRFNHEKLKQAFSPKTRGIIINTPQNPTGTVFSLEELTLISELCVKFDAIAITDEVYEFLVFDDAKHHAMASLPGMRERTVTISSTAKTYSMTGWKIGYTLAPPEATQVIRRMHQYILFAVATPFQHGMAEGIRQRDALIPPLVADLKRNRDVLAEGLTEMGFKVVKPQGSFFMLADFSELSDKPDTEFAVELVTSKTAVGTIPVSVFYPPELRPPTHYLRFCFAKRSDTITKGLARLRAHFA